MYGADAYDDKTGNIMQSVELQNDPVLRKCIGEINEQALRDEFRLKGRDYHVADYAF